MSTQTMTTKNEETLHESTKRTRPIDIYAAPDCDIDLLANVPRVTLGPDGKPHLALLPLEYEGEIGEEVEATAMLPLTDLMLVRTCRGAYLMKSSDYEANLPKPTSEEFDQQDARDMAADLINGMMSGMCKQQLDPTADLLWHAGARLMEAGGINSRFERLGILDDARCPCVVS